MKNTRLFLSLTTLVVLLVLGTGIVTAHTTSDALRTLTGIVVDTQGSPITNACIRETGFTAHTAQTDADGKFTIAVRRRATSLSCHAAGYRECTVQAGATIRSLRVVMQPLSAPQVEEAVLVVGYGRQFECAKTGALCTANVSGNDRYVACPIFIHNDVNTESYTHRGENRFIGVSTEPLSTFSLEADGASYSNIRRMINGGQAPEADAVRIEEMINYFTYNYPAPKGSDPVAISTETGTCPWNSEHRLVRIGVKARELDSDALPASNFVFLIDVSGSMSGPTRLDLVVASMKLLVNNLREQDRVSIVTYAGTSAVVLTPTSGADRQKIREALDNLHAGGSTAGAEGIRTAYQTARGSFIKGGNNRVILCTDGDFNVGVSSEEGLEALITRERQSGVFLTVLGYGMGNYKDDKLQTLAEKGNGTHAYIDNIQEANRVLVSEFGASIYTVAKDVKLQVEFNPSQVQSYRLVGYESRLLNKEDFNDDTKDAGELGAGHTVTALYEVVPVGAKGNVPGSVDPLKYQPKTLKSATAPAGGSDEMLTVKLRYKLPDSDQSRLLSQALTDHNGDRVSADFRFASAVAMFGQLLRNSDFRGKATYDDVVALASKGLGDDREGYRREFVRLAQSMRGLDAANR